MKISFIFILFILTAGSGFSTANPSDFPKYSNEKKLSSQLQVFRKQLFQAQSSDEQAYLLELIKKNSDPQKYDIMMDFALWDIQGANIYGRTHNVPADIRRDCVSNVGNSASPKYIKAYWYIMVFDPGVEIRKIAALSLGKLKSPGSITVIVSLLNEKYNFAHFDATKLSMEEEDKAANALVEALGENGSPKALPILLQIVNMQNHRPKTVESAWIALDKLKMNSPAYNAFIQSLKDMMKEKTEQVDFSQKEQVGKTVETLTQFIRKNLANYGYDDYDVKTLTGNAPEKNLDTDVFQYQ